MMLYKGYIGNVEFDPDAKILHGDVIGIRDVITFQADSAAKIEKAFHDSVDDYLAFCKKRGELPEKAMSGKFVVRVEPTLHRKLNMIAELKKQSLNSLVEEFLAVETIRTLHDFEGENKKAAVPGQSLKASRRSAS